MCNIIDGVDMDVVGRNVRRLRKEAGLSIKALAHKAHVAVNTAGFLETGGAFVSQAKAAQIAEALGTDLESLAVGEPMTDYSIVQADLGRCFICRKLDATPTPIYPDRPEASRKHGLVVSLCKDCNLEVYKGIAKRKGQKAFEEIYGKYRFAQEFGKDYRRVNYEG